MFAALHESAFDPKRTSASPSRKAGWTATIPAWQAPICWRSEYIYALKGVGGETAPRACADRTAEAV